MTRVGASFNFQSRGPSTYRGRLVTLEESFNGGAWRIAVTSRIDSTGAFALRFKARVRGLVRLRVDYPDGTTALGQTRVA